MLCCTLAGPTGPLNIRFLSLLTTVAAPSLGLGYGTVVEKLRPLAMLLPRMRLKSSALGTGGPVPMSPPPNLLPNTYEERGDSTSFGSIARKNRTKSFASDQSCCSSAVSSNSVAYCLLTEDGSRFCRMIR
uniref:Putative secreted peptide n=1 Tax=Anopheles braziliensis TaxID=58242 RepID=A0A2M3ZRS8_9DIPT